MAATVRDVANAASVSLATVSKVLNGRYDGAAETAQMVERAIQDMGYQRSATNRGRRAVSSLSSSSGFRSYKEKTINGIALFTPTKLGAGQSLLTAHFVDGAESVANKHGLHFHLARPSQDGRLPACLDPVQVDGLIVRSTQEPLNIDLPPIPMVWIFKLNYESTPGDLVMPDNEKVGEMAADYLLKRGHQHVGVLGAVNARVDHPEAQLRTDRFVRRVRHAGATAFSIENSDMDAVADQIVTHSPRVTGLFMPLGDNHLEHLYRALQRRGIRCGGDGADINIISCNNDATHLRLLDPTLANIDIRADEIGRAAAETLLWRILNPKEYRRCVLIDPVLVEPALTLRSAGE